MKINIKIILVGAMLLICNWNQSYSQVINSSYIAKNGEKVLQFSITLPTDKKTVWGLFTIDTNLQKWIAPLAHIDLKIGGTITTNYDVKKSLSDSSSIKLFILNYLENELITMKVNLNNTFSKKLQNEDKNLQEIIQITEIDKNKTKIICSMVGWGVGKDWEETYKFFEKGNEWTFQKIIDLYKK